MTATFSPKKPRKMREAEARAGKPMEEALPELLNLFGWKETIIRLQADRSTIGYWLAWLGIVSRNVYIPKGYRLLLLPNDWKLPQIDLTEVAE